MPSILGSVVSQRFVHICSLPIAAADPRAKGGKEEEGSEDPGGQRWSQTDGQHPAPKPNLAVDALVPPVSAGHPWGWDCPFTKPTKRNHLNREE